MFASTKRPSTTDTGAGKRGPNMKNLRSTKMFHGEFGPDSKPHFDKNLVKDSREDNLRNSLTMIPNKDLF